MHFENGKGVFFWVLPSASRAVGGAECGQIARNNFFFVAFPFVYYLLCVEDYFPDSSEFHKLKSRSLHLVNFFTLNNHAQKILAIRDECDFVRINLHIGIKSEIRALYYANVPQILNGRIFPRLCSWRI